MTTHFLADEEESENSFDEPWQVEAFATVVALARREVFGWQEWAQTLAAVAREEPASADESVTTAYYRQWITALERLLDKHVGLNTPDFDERVRLWREAYLGTPHGHPVELANYVHCPSALAEADQNHDHDHDHDHFMIGASELRERVKPVTIDPARAAKHL